MTCIIVKLKHNNLKRLYSGFEENKIDQSAEYKKPKLDSTETEFEHVPSYI